jgi:16S rRNA processing protein RimM
VEANTYTPSAERLIALGEIAGTHGVRGQLRFRPYSSDASSLPTDRPLYLTAPSSPGEHPDASTARAVHVDAAHPHGKVLLLKIAGIDDLDAARSLVGLALAIPEGELPEPALGEFYVFQLKGLNVVTDRGDRLGTVDGSFSTGANEVLVVRNGSREYLIPVIADVVRAIDVSQGRVVIDPIDGLLDG